MSVIGLFASGCILTGIWLYGRKSLLAPAISAVGCIVWFYIGIVHDMFDLAVLNAILFVVNAFNFAVWYKEQRPEGLAKQFTEDVRNGTKFLRPWSRFIRR